jgi:hypothetical protein
MDNSEFIEKRAFSRFPVSIPLEYSASISEKTGQAYTHDISAQGLDIITNEELPAGTALNICLRMADNGEEIRRRATVVWSDMIEPDKYRAGIKLEEPKIKPIPLVLRIISQRI